MRVLFLVTLTQSPVGMNTFIFSQGESLKAAGVEVEYFYLHGRGALKYLTGIRRLRRHLRAHRYDIVHAHYSYNGYVALCQKKCPVVVSLMGSDVLEKYHFIKGSIENHVRRRVTRKAAAVICKTRQMMDVLGRERNVFLVPNGVDLDFFRPLDRADCRRKLGLAGDKKYVLFAADPGRKEKNFTLARDAVGALQDPNVELLPVSGVKQDKLLLYYNAADALLLTSHYEGSPNVVKEALGCGLPVVSTDVGDVAELFKDCGLGRLADGTPEGVATALRKTLGRDRDAGGCPGIHNYGLPIIAGRIKEIYESLPAAHHTGNA